MSRRLDYIVWFRAFAIMLIVAGHSFAYSGAEFRNLLDRDLYNLIKGATALFVFISGYLFDYLHPGAFDYRTFVLGRIRRILVPYLVLTALAWIVFSPVQPENLSFESVFRDLLLGDTFQAYWYVPFILIMFALAPLHRLFGRLGLYWQLAVLGLSTLAAMLIQRPVGNDNPLQAMLFYLPVFWLGILVSARRDRLLPLLRLWAVPLVLATIAVAHVQSLGGQLGNMQNTLLTYNGFELMGAQKMLMALAITALFSFGIFRAAPAVNLIAETSFAVFFLHPFGLELLKDTGLFRLTGYMWPDLLFTTAFVMAACIGIAVLLRRVLGWHSRYIIGY